MIIYRKSDLITCGNCNGENGFIEQIHLNVIPNFGGTIEDYSAMETDLQRFHLERNEAGEVIAVEDGLSVDEQRQEILGELARLDTIVPRILEDIVAQGNFNLHQNKLDIITQKESLRQQLRELEV